MLWSIHRQSSRSLINSPLIVSFTDQFTANRLIHWSIHWQSSHSLINLLSHSLIISLSIVSFTDQFTVNRLIYWSIHRASSSFAYQLIANRLIHRSIYPQSSHSLINSLPIILFTDQVTVINQFTIIHLIPWSIIRHSSHSLTLPIAIAGPDQVIPSQFIRWWIGL